MRNNLCIVAWTLALAVPAAWADYELMWDEEFDGALDTSSWTLDTYHGVVRSANDAGFYTARPENIQVADGVLKLVARKEAYDLAAFTTARLHTYGNKAFAFGRFSVRMKAPAVRGIRPQISLLPVELTYGSWPASGEIELFTVDNGAVTSALHFGGSGPRGTHVGNRYAESPALEPDGAFHVYTVEWQPYEIRWFIDDILVAMQTQWSSAAAPNPSPFDRPFYLAVGMAVERPDAEQLEGWPYAMEIDWIRVHQSEGNRAPVVKLTGPASDAQLPGARTISITAEASDPDGNLAGVEFYSDTTRLGLDREAPYAFDWKPADGCYLVSARAVDADGFGRTETVDVTVGQGCPPTPFGGTAAAIPGRVEAENFDESRRGEAYFDFDPSNNGGGFRLDSGVDIQHCSDGGFNLGWMMDNEWTRYTVSVAADGKYDLRVRVASPNDTARIRLEVDGKNVSGPLAIPNTGDWQNFTDVMVRDVQLEAGLQVLRMVVEKEGLNLDYIEIVPSRN